LTGLATDAYVRTRGGLADIPTRLRSEDCTIAYMGASVTAQKDGYRPRLHEQLKAETGRDHRAVNAALGATGAITGVFLMDELALTHRPDLALVEYATSDVVGTTPLAQLVPVLEGIVGKLRRAGCEACFVYLRREEFDLRTSGVIAAYEEVAERHGVPSIDVAAWLDAKISGGEVERGAVLRDVVHTTELGSALTAEAIRDALMSIRPVPGRASARPKDEGYLAARLEEASPTFAAGGPFAEGTFRLVRRYVEIDASGDLRCTPRGELVGLFVVLGPHSGYVEVSWGGRSFEHLLWDEDCAYERLGSVILDPFVPSGAEVRIRVSGRPVDRSAAKRPVDVREAARPRLKLAGLMIRS
jgi:hypothetical protein